MPRTQMSLGEIRQGAPSKYVGFKDIILSLCTRYILYIALVCSLFTRQRVGLHNNLVKRRFLQIV